MKEILSFIGCIAFLYASYVGYNEYRMNQEVNDFSYAALKVFLEENDEDVYLVQQVENSLSGDNEIDRKEHLAMINYILEKYGMYEGAKVGADHSHAKQEFLTTFKSLYGGSEVGNG